VQYTSRTDGLVTTTIVDTTGPYFDVSYIDNMWFITEAEHVRSTSDRYIEQFEDPKMRLGMDRYRSIGSVSPR
jgi:hypothetical protein